MKKILYTSLIGLLLLSGQQDIKANAIIRDSVVLLGAGLLLHTKASYNWSALKYAHKIPSFILKYLPTNLSPIQPSPENGLSQVQATGINMGINASIGLMKKSRAIISAWMNFRLFNSNHAVENNNGIARNIGALITDTAPRAVLNTVRIPAVPINPANNFIANLFPVRKIKGMFCSKAGAKAVVIGEAENALKRLSRTIAYETIALICLSKAIPQLYNAL